MSAEICEENLSLSDVIPKHQMTMQEYETLSWKTLSKFFSEVSQISHQLQSFDDFITFGMQEIVDQESTIKTDKYTVIFGEISLAPPQVIEEDRKLQGIYPSDARRRNLTYDSAIQCNITEHYYDDSGTEIERKIHTRVVLGRMPVMVGSSYCNLKGLSESEKIKRGECPSDKGGYFIIKGNERVLTTQVRANYNQIIVLAQKEDKKHSFVAEVRSMSAETAHSVLVKCMISKDERNICFSLPNIKAEIPVGIVFKAMGIVDDRDILSILGITDRKLSKYLRYIIRDAGICETQNDALKYIGRYAMNIIEEHKHRDFAKQIVETELFPHMGITATVRDQALYLAQMVKKLIRTTYSSHKKIKNPLEDREEDDRDNIAMKRLEPAGALIYEIFRNLYKKYITFISDQIAKKKQNPDIISIISRIKSITKGLHQCMATGNWSVQKNAAYIRTGVSQILDRMTYTSTVSHLRRVIVPTGKTGKNAAMRQLHPSSVCFLCPAETPEGNKVGVVINLSLSANISRKIPSVLVKRVLEELKTVTKLKDMILKDVLSFFPVYHNGCLIGFSEDYNNTLQELMTLRRYGYLDKQVSISYDFQDKEVRIFSDEGRLIRPLFVMENNTLRISSLENLSEVSWNYLIDNEYIRYVDPAEINFSVVAMSSKKFCLQKSSFCELHPSLMLGSIASCIPFPDHTQSPRNIYYSSMCKQALGIPLYSYKTRSDTVLHVMNYPQKRIVSSKYDEYLGFNKMPNGFNVIIAVACYGGSIGPQLVQKTS